MFEPQNHPLLWRWWWRFSWWRTACLYWLSSV